jgi:hypothetical protein
LPAHRRSRRPGVYACDTGHPDPAQARRGCSIALNFQRFPADASISGREAMSSMHYRSSRPDQWTMPRPYQDANLRYIKHGPIRPMEEPGFLARLFGRGKAPRP